MKRLGLVGAVLAFVSAVTSGCTRSHSSAATVVGHYREVGGLPPGLSRPILGTVWAYPGHAAPSQVLTMPPEAHVHTDAAGRFELTLKPGEYTLFGAQGLSHSVKYDGCGAVVVHAQAATTTTADLVCSVP